jgi:hypothetical protein
MKTAIFAPAIWVLAALAGPATARPAVGELHPNQTETVAGARCGGCTIDSERTSVPHHQRENER